MKLDHYNRYLLQPPVDLLDRVSLVMEAIERSVERRPGESTNQANVRHMEAFFAFIVGLIPTKLLLLSADHISGLDHFLTEHFLWVVIMMPILQLAILLRLFSHELPAWMDNAYRHLNRADNLHSLRRSRRK